MGITKKVAERIRTGLKRFSPVLVAQRARDVSEADTVTIVKDLLSEVFGYDKYSELTSEHAIRGTFCDLAIKFDDKVQLLIEVKAIGSDLQDRHVKQSIDYASNQGVEWVILTNGIEWVLFHVIFKKPIDKEEIVRINLAEIDTRQDESIEKLYLLTRDGLSKDALKTYRDRQEATNRFLVAAILLNSEPVMSAIRREVRRVTEILVSPEEIQQVLKDQVLKRDTLEGEQAVAAARRFDRRSEQPIVKFTRGGKSEEPEAPTPSSAPDHRVGKPT